MDEALDRLHLHQGHDYRRADRDAAGHTVAVYGLGAGADMVAALLRALPGHTAKEISRVQGVGSPFDRLRVDIVPATAVPPKRARPARRR